MSVEFFRKEYWLGLPFPSPGYLPDPRIEPGSCRQIPYHLSHQGSLNTHTHKYREIYRYLFTYHLCFHCHSSSLTLILLTTVFMEKPCDYIAAMQTIQENPTISRPSTSSYLQWSFPIKGNRLTASCELRYSHVWGAFILSIRRVIKS